MKPIETTRPTDVALPPTALDLPPAGLAEPPPGAPREPADGPAPRAATDRLETRVASPVSADARLQALAASLGRLPGGERELDAYLEQLTRWEAGRQLLRAAASDVSAFRRAVAESAGGGAAGVRRSSACAERLAGALRRADGEEVRTRAQERLASVRGEVGRLTAELEERRWGPAVDRFFGRVAALPAGERGRVLAAHGLTLGSEWLSGDHAWALFERSSSTQLEDPAEARAQLVESGEVTFGGHRLTSADLAASLRSLDGALADAARFIDETPEPLLTLRAVAREAAGSEPSVRTSFAARREAARAPVLEAPADGWLDRLTAPWRGADTRLSEALFAAGVIDWEQHAQAVHAERMGRTLALASLFSPEPLRDLLAPIPGAGKAADRLVGKPASAVLERVYDASPAYDAPLEP